MSNIFRKQGINTGGGGSTDTSSLANKTDLTAIILTGTTNTSGGTISAGTWFYLNGTPCIAKVDIASGATFTEGTNYEEKTIGSALSELNGKSAKYFYNNQFTCENAAVFFNVRTIYSKGLYIIECGWWGAGKCTGITITNSDGNKQVIVENPEGSSTIDTQLVYLKPNNDVEYIQVRMERAGLGSYNLIYLSV